MPAYPEDRPGTYDESKVWDENTQTWVTTEDLLRKGGSRYRSILVAIGKDLIYFEGLD